MWHKMEEAKRIGGVGESLIEMEKKVLVLDADETGSQDLVELLAGRQYPTSSIHILSDLEEHLGKLTIKYPEVHFLCTSKDRFHPNLKDAICYHIYACLTKPVDPDEIFYLLRSIYEDDTDPNK
jgi:hypothetical protein